MSKPRSTKEKASLEEVHRRFKHLRTHRQKRTSRSESLREASACLCAEHNLGTVSGSLRPEGKSYSLPVKQFCNMSNYREFFASKYCEQ